MGEVTVVSNSDSESQITQAIGDSKSARNEKSSVSSGNKPNDEIKSNASDAMENDQFDDQEKNEGELREDEESEQDEQDEEEVEKKPKKKGGFQKRIERFQKKLTEKDQELEFWKAKALSDKNPINDQMKVQDAKPESVISNKPQEKDFDTHADYIEALTDWKIEQRDKLHEQKQKEIKVKSDLENQVKGLQSKIEDFKKTTKDFDEVVSNVDDIPMSFNMQDAIITSDYGPQLMYELAKNSDEFERINSLGPVALAKEIAKIELRLESQKDQKKEVKTTKAPPPIEPIGKRVSTGDKKPEDMDYSEFKKWREQQK